MNAIKSQILFIKISFFLIFMFLYLFGFSQSEIAQYQELKENKELNTSKKIKLATEINPTQMISGLKNLKNEIPADLMAANS